MILIVDLGYETPLQYASGLYLHTPEAIMASDRSWAWLPRCIFVIIKCSHPETTVSILLSRAFSREQTFPCYVPDSVEPSPSPLILAIDTMLLLDRLQFRRKMVMMVSEWVEKSTQLSRSRSLALLYTDLCGGESSKLKNIWSTTFQIVYRSGTDRKDSADQGCHGNFPPQSRLSCIHDRI